MLHVFQTTIDPKSVFTTEFFIQFYIGELIAFLGKLELAPI